MEGVSLVVLLAVCFEGLQSCFTTIRIIIIIT